MHNYVGHKWLIGIVFLDRPDLFIKNNRVELVHPRIKYVGDLDAKIGSVNITLFCRFCVFVLGSSCHLVGDHSFVHSVLLHTLYNLVLKHRISLS